MLGDRKARVPGSKKKGSGGPKKMSGGSKKQVFGGSKKNGLGGRKKRGGIKIESWGVKKKRLTASKRISRTTEPAWLGRCSASLHPSDWLESGGAASVFDGVIENSTLTYFDYHLSHGLMLL